MNHQQLPALPAPPPPPFSGGDCGNCGAHLEGLLLHNVRLRGIQRRLCTSCVLRLHPSLFCPVCFDFYDSNPPHPSKRFSCSNCSSFTHSHCLPSPLPPSPYLCPPCSAPSPASFSFFSVSSSAVDGGGRRIDSVSAAVLLCAARISSASMAKAAAVARMEAEKKAKEAATARKKAREALERVGMLVTPKSNVNVAQNNSNGNGVGGGGGGGGGDGSAAASFFKEEVVNNVEMETG